VTVRGYEPTSAWFNIEYVFHIFDFCGVSCEPDRLSLSVSLSHRRTFDDLSQGENLNEFVHSQRQINELVDQERAKMIDEGKEPRIALLGFSQGTLSSHYQCIRYSLMMPTITNRCGDDSTQSVILERNGSIRRLRRFISLRSAARPPRRCTLTLTLLHRALD